MLTRVFAFKDFSEALLFVNKVGEIAESQNHHPDIAIENYNHVRIATTTHDEGNVVTEKDYKLAGAVDTIQ